MDENIERSDLPRGNTVPQSLILRKLCFPESRSLLVHLMLFPYRYLFINVGSNHLLNFFLNPKKSLLDYFSFIAFGCLYFLIIWGGMFGLLGLFLTAAITGALPSAQGTSAGEFSPDTGLALIFLPFMVLGWILGVYVLKVRYTFYKIPMESHEGIETEDETRKVQMPRNDGKIYCPHYHERIFPSGCEAIKAKNKCNSECEE